MPPVLVPENTGDDAGAVTDGAAATADGVITVTDTDDENSVLTFATVRRVYRSPATLMLAIIPADPDPTAVTTPQHHQCRRHGYRHPWRLHPDP